MEAESPRSVHLVGIYCMSQSEHHHSVGMKTGRISHPEGGRQGSAASWGGSVGGVPEGEEFHWGPSEDPDCIK